MIEKWADKHHLTCHIVGEPTHRAGNTLDLVWSNIDGARAWVDRGECVTSDHFPIRGQIPVRNSVMRPEKAKLRVTKEKLPRYAKVIAKWVRPPPVLDTIERVEEYAQEICFHLTNAINAVGTRPRTSSGRSAPWWTSACKVAYAEYKSAITPHQRALCVKRLRLVVKASKKEFKTQQVESITTPNDVFKLMRMSNPRQASIPPPLKHNGMLITDPLKRATILRDALLARYQASDDLFPYTVTSSSRIPWEEDVSDEEVRACTIGCGNTAPGADGISVNLLEAC